MNLFVIFAFAISAISHVCASPAPFTPDPVNNVQFYVESENQLVDGKGLYHLHEGAAVNFVFLGDNAATYKYDYMKDIISTNDGNIEFFFSVLTGVDFPTLQFSAASSYYTKWSVECGYLKGNGSSNVYVAKNTGDPYNYSKDLYQVGLFPDGQLPPAHTTDVDNVKIRVVYV